MDDVEKTEAGILGLEKNRDRALNIDRTPLGIWKKQAGDYFQKTGKYAIPDAVEGQYMGKYWE